MVLHVSHMVKKDETKNTILKNLPKINFFEEFTNTKFNQNFLNSSLKFYGKLPRDLINIFTNFTWNLLK